MKKLIVKDKITRKKIKSAEILFFVFKIISNNTNLSNLMRFNAFYSSSFLTGSVSKTRISNRCVNTINKKKFQNLTNFSRIFFRKLIRNKNIYGFKKTSW